MNFSLIKEYKGYVLFAALVLGGIFTIENINDRFWLNDFKVYYLAAKNLLAGDPVYGVVLGLDTGFYKYSPSILLAFVPFTFMSYYAASVVHFCAIALAALFCTLLVQRTLMLYVLPAQHRPASYLLPVAFVCVLNHLFRELHLGNVNMIIVCFLSAALYFLMSGKDVKCGILLGIVVLIKPYLLLLSLPLFLHQKFRSLFSQVLTLLFSVVPVFVFFGFSKTIALHTQWVKAVLYHSEYLTSEHTLVALIRKYLHVGMPDSYQFYVLIFFTLTYLLVFAFFIRPRIKKDPAKENGFLFLSYFTLLALIPSILITDTEHFLFASPLLIFAFNHLWVPKSTFLKSLFVFIVLVYGTAGGGIFGSNVNERFEELGLLGIANLGIIIFVLFVFSKDLYKKTSSANA
ncbi:MAG: glycosyltransferase family 87 protein [bacterium]|nr:glycosyltransferase family 87 protein [bacterium]